MDRNGKSSVFFNPNLEEGYNRQNEESSEFPVVPFSGFNLFKGYEDEQGASCSTGDKVTKSNDYLFFSNFEKQHKKVRSSNSSTPNNEKEGVVSDPIIEKSTDGEDIIINHEKSTKKCKSISEDSIWDDFNHSNETMTKDFSHIPSDNSSTPSNFSELNKKSSAKSFVINEILHKLQNNDKSEKNIIKNNENKFPKRAYDSKSNLNKTIEDFRNFTTSSYKSVKSRKENNDFRSLFDPLKNNSFITDSKKNPPILNSFSSLSRNSNFANTSNISNFNPLKHVNKMFSIHENLDEKLRTKPKTDLLNFGQSNKKSNLLHDFSWRNKDYHKSNSIFEPRDFGKSKFKSSTEPYLTRFDSTNALDDRSSVSRIPLTGSAFNEKRMNIQSTNDKIVKGRTIYEPASTIKIPGIGGMGQNISEVIDKYSKNFMNSNNGIRKIPVIENFRMDPTFKRNSTNRCMVNTLNNGMHLKSDFKNSKVPQIPIHNDIENAKESTVKSLVAIQESEGDFQTAKN